MADKQPDARLEDLEVREVSIVDRPAIKRKFLVVTNKRDSTEDTMARRAVPANEGREEDQRGYTSFSDILGIVAAATTQDTVSVEKSAKAGEALKVTTNALEILTSMVEDAKKVKGVPDGCADKMKKLTDELHGLAKKVSAVSDAEKEKRKAAEAEESEKRAKGDKEMEAEKVRRAKEDEELKAKGHKLSSDDEKKRAKQDEEAGAEKSRRAKYDEEQKSRKVKDDEDLAAQEKSRKADEEDMAKAGGDAVKALTGALGKLMAIVNQLKGMDAGAAVPVDMAANIKSIADAMIAAVSARAKKSDDEEMEVFRAVGSHDSDPDPEVIVKRGAKIARHRLSELEKIYENLGSLLKGIKGEARMSVGKGDVAPVVDAITKMQGDVTKGFEAMADKLNGIVERVGKLEGARPAGAGDGDPPVPQRTQVQKDDGLWTNLFR